jgi:hypothetical protein
VTKIHTHCNEDINSFKNIAANNAEKIGYDWATGIVLETSPVKRIF